MISRLLPHSLNVGQRIVQTHTLRLLRTATVAASSHDEPLPVHVPRPATRERNWLGSLKGPQEQYPSEPYVPRKSDLFSFIGAGIGVVLTVIAVSFYNDIFGGSPVKKSTSEDASHHEPSKESLQSAEIARAEQAESSEDATTRESHQTQKTEELIPEASSHPEDSEERAKEPAGQSSHEGNREVSSSPELKQSQSSHAPIEGSSPENESSPAPEQSTSFKDDKSEPNSTTVVHKKEATDEPKGEEVPKFVEYLLIGAGTAAYYASLAIRARHADAKVLMIGEEEHPPYNRPPLSKELWWYSDGDVADTLQYTGVNGKKRDVFFEADGFFVPPSELPTTLHGGVSLLKGRRVERINPEEKKAYLDDKTCIQYDKCLIATGGKPKTLPELENSPDVKEKVINLRGVDDYRKLESVCHSSKSITIVGGGFLGSELAYSIHRKYGNLQIKQLIAESGHLSGILPKYLSKKATESLRECGIDVITNAEITSARTKGGKVELEVNGSRKIASDYIVVAIGVEPDTSVAKASGLEVDERLGGVTTDAELRVRTGIWAAGDAASFYDKSLGRRRIEHWENAQVSGRLAGENMTGAAKAFWYQPSFFTKISPKWHINAVGNTDSSLKTVSVFAKSEDGEESFDRGVVFYKGENDKVVGVLLLNVFGSGVDVARRLIEEARCIEDFAQVAKLFSLYKPTQSNDKEN